MYNLQDKFNIMPIINVLYMDDKTQGHTRDKRPFLSNSIKISADLNINRVLFHCQQQNNA